MDTELLIRRIELHKEYLNTQRKAIEFMDGVDYAFDFVINAVCVLVDAEEEADDEEARQEAYLEASDGCCD